MMDFIDQINDHLNRLGVSTEQDPHSGLMAEPVDPNKSADAAINASTVLLLDDYSSAYYNGEKLLEILEGLNPNQVSLDGDSTNNIWQLIYDCEV